MRRAGFTYLSSLLSRHFLRNPPLRIPQRVAHGTPSRTGLLRVPQRVEIGLLAIVISITQEIGFLTIMPFGFGLRIVNPCGAC